MLMSGKTPPVILDKFINRIPRKHSSDRKREAVGQGRQDSAKADERSTLRRVGMLHSIFRLAMTPMKWNGRDARTPEEGKSGGAVL